jgi:hypothetical protein
VAGTVVLIKVAVSARVEPGIEVMPVLGIAVRGVAVSIKKRMGVEEAVVVNVSVGVGVTVRVFVIVGVGPVAVGKGP